MEYLEAGVHYHEVENPRRDAEGRVLRWIEIMPCGKEQVLGAYRRTLEVHVRLAAAYLEWVNLQQTLSISLANFLMFLLAQERREGYHKLRPHFKQQVLPNHPQVQQLVELDKKWP